MRVKEVGHLEYQARGIDQWLHGLTGQRLIPAGYSNFSERNPQKEIGSVRMRFFVEALRYQMADTTPGNSRLRQIKDTLTDLNDLDDKIDRIVDDGRLYPYQLEVVNRYRAFYRNGQPSGYFDLPMGYGKTYLIGALIGAINRKALILGPTQESLDQIRDVVGEMNPGLVISRNYEGYDEGFDDPVSLMTYAGFNTRMLRHEQDSEEEELNPGRFGLAIADEAHLTLGSLTRLNFSKLSNAIKLGFTATPGYTQRRHIREIFGPEISSLSILDARLRGIISPFRVWVVELNADLSKIPISKTSGDYSPRRLDEILARAGYNDIVTRLYLDYFLGEKAVSFHHTVRQARDLAVQLTSNGINAIAVDGLMDPDTRRRAIEGFRNGMFNVLCCARLLETSFDDPRISVVLSSPTTSTVREKQRIGRGLRPVPGKRLTVVDFVGRTTRGVTFVDAVGTAAIGDADYPDGGNSGNRNSMSESGRSLLTPISISGAKLYQDPVEVMDYLEIGQSTPDLSQPEDFSRIRYFELSQIYQVRVGDILKAVRKARRNSPDLFLELKEVKYGRMYASEDGFSLLEQILLNQVRIQNRIRETRHIKKLQTKFTEEHLGVTHHRFLRAVRKLSQTDGSGIIKEGDGKSTRYYITGGGQERLEQALSVIPVGFSPVEIQSVLERGISKAVVWRTVAKVAEVFPDHIKHLGKGYPIVASKYGAKLLYGVFAEELERRRAEEDRISVSIIGLSREYNIRQEDVSKALTRLASEYPDDIQLPKSNRPASVSAKGQELIMSVVLSMQNAKTQRSVVPEGFSKLDIKEIAASNGVSNVTLHNRIRRLMDDYPDEFQQQSEGRKPFFATEYGLELLLKSFK